MVSFFSVNKVYVSGRRLQHKESECADYYCKMKMKLLELICVKHSKAAEKVAIKGSLNLI